MMRPSWDKYSEAQARHREQFGHEVIFHTPVDRSYPPGTPLNSAGLPLDPSIDGSGDGWADGSGIYTVITGPVGSNDDVEASPVGYLPEDHLVVVVPQEDVTDEIEAATELTHKEVRYRVTSHEWRVFGPNVSRLIGGARL